ncbi:hypothetical protein F5X99DRAFT_16491 [Biscogniauxia marginata]|nr:hypothetical protein F5X99DRAFT_16491 [Biscogniauxia marginata]
MLGEERIIMRNDCLLLYHPPALLTSNDPYSQLLCNPRAFFFLVVSRARLSVFWRETESPTVQLEALKKREGKVLPPFAICLLNCIAFFFYSEPQVHEKDWHVCTRLFKQKTRDRHAGRTNGPQVGAPLSLPDPSPMLSRKKRKPKNHTIDLPGEERQSKEEENV